MQLCRTTPDHSVFIQPSPPIRRNQKTANHPNKCINTASIMTWAHHFPGGRMPTDTGRNLSDKLMQSRSVYHPADVRHFHRINVCAGDASCHPRPPLPVLGADTWTDKDPTRIDMRQKSAITITIHGKAPSTPGRRAGSGTRKWQGGSQ